MEFIANYKDWVTDELMSHLINHTGDTVNVWQPHRWQGHPVLDDARERAREGYSSGLHTFQQFNPRSEDMSSYKIDLPKIPGEDDSRIFLWWFIKLLPGQMQAMHIDPHLLELEKKNPRRYSLFLEDFKPGHIFVWDTFIKSDYKAGDLYMWNDPMCYHGCVNIAFEPRYTLQITTHDA